LNLVVDIGNSRTKLATFLKKELVDLWTVDELKIGRLEEIRKIYPDLESAILSTVSSVDPQIISYLNSAFSHFLELNYLTPVPINNLYKTPQTLGLDRLAAAIGACELFPGKDLLVIDAGTAITFDLIDSNGTFRGGNISPGLRSRFRALHEFTRNLPLIEETGEYTAIGRTTEEAIHAGVINGMVFEIDGTINLFSENRPGLQPLLTGGDAHFFERRLKNAIFVKFEITLIGLNRILEYNVENQ